MKHRSHPWGACFFLILIFVLSGAKARASDGAGLRLTLEEAIQLSQERNFEAAAARLEVEAAHADRITAGLIPNPQFSVNETFINPSAPRAGSQVSARAEQPFETFGKRGRRIRSAESAKKSAEYHLSDRLRQLTLDVQTTFFQVLWARERLRLAQDNADRFGAILKINTLRYEKGDISEAEIIKVRLQQLDFQSDIISAALEIQEAEKRLKGLLVVDPSTPVEPIGALQYRPVRIDLKSLRESALQSRPDLREKESDLEKSESDLRLAQAMRFPDVSVGIEYDTIGPDYHGLFGAGVTIPLPIFNRNQGEIRKAEADLRIAKTVLTERSHQIALDVEYSYQEFLRNQAQVSIFESGLLQDARSSREIAENAYKKGGSNILDFLEAERTFNATTLNYYQALFNYQKSLFQLEYVSGKEIAP